MTEADVLLEGISGGAFGDLRRRAEQIVLFGSRAAGRARPASDWDLLCVAEQRPSSIAGVDLIWISPCDLSTPAWLGSELAGHVAAWGRWLHGEPDWISSVVHGERAATRKAQRVASKLVALERAWDALGPAYQRRHLLLLRRDLQRHGLLSRGEPVPPTALLDDAWRACADRRGELQGLARGAQILSPFFDDIAAHLSETGVRVTS